MATVKLAKVIRGKGDRHSPSKTNKKRRKKVEKRQWVWNAKEWYLSTPLARGIDLLHSRLQRGQYVIRKTLRLPHDKVGHMPREVRILDLLPECNRILKTLAYIHDEPSPRFGAAFFEYCPLSDLDEWKMRHYDKRNFKFVPESCIWRMFIQMTQALAFLQKELGSATESQPIIIHRDIKPPNILVVQAAGTSYPSFKLHDFGLATVFTPEKAEEEAILGTFEWQPPENPLINTAAADIWSLGACVHFLALGKPPIENPLRLFHQVNGRHHRRPSSIRQYSDAMRYSAARAPRLVTPINLSEDEQAARGVTLRIHPTIITTHTRRNFQYSDQLQLWMERTLSMKAAMRPTIKRLLNQMVPVGRQMLKALGGQGGLVDMDFEYGV